MIRGPYGNNRKLYPKAIELRSKGYGYGWISKELGVSRWTLRHWLKDIKVDRSAAVKLGVPKIQTANLKSKGALRTRFILERGHKCESCELSEWLGRPIQLELHGHRIPSSAKLLCPNCHSQTPDWRRKK